MDEKELLKLKKDIDKKKEQYLTDKGELEGLLKRLKTEYNCETVEKAQAILDKLKKELKKKDAKISESEDKLKKLLNVKD